MYRTLALHLVLALVGCGDPADDSIVVDPTDTFVDPIETQDETQTGDSDTGPTGETETTGGTGKGETGSTAPTGVVCDSGDTGVECRPDDTHTDPVIETGCDSGDTDCIVVPVDSGCDSGDTDCIVVPVDSGCDSGDTSPWCDTGPVDPGSESGLACESADTSAECQPDPCALTFEFTSGTYGAEMSVEILDRDGNVVADWDGVSDGGFTNFTASTATWTVSLDPDDITIVLLDSYGDGWNGATVEVTTMSGEVVADISDFTSGSSYDIDYRHDCDGTFVADTYCDSGDSGNFCWPTVEACTMEFSWTAQSTWYTGDAFFSVYDEDGNLVFTENFDNATGWDREEILSSGNYYAVMYYDYGYSPLSNDFSVTETSTGETEATISMDLSGYDWEWFTVDCADDTAWSGQETGWEDPEEGDMPPELTPFWSDTYDTADDGNCTFMLQMVGPTQPTWPYDYTLGDEIAYTLFDDEKNVVDSMAFNDVDINRNYIRPVNLDAGRYMVHLQDSAGDGWEGGYLRVVTPDGDIVENLYLESGESDDYVYLDLECEGDTFEHWDSAPDLENDTAWWAPDPYFGCPLMIALNTDGRAYEMDFNITDAVTGDIVYASTDEWLGGIVESGDVQYASLALPDGSYNLNLIEDNTYYGGWNYYSWVRAYDTEGGFVAGGGLFGTSGTAVYPFDWACTTDTSAWWPDEIDAMRDDSGWTMGQGWADTDLAETCGFTVEVLTPYNASGGAWEIYDLEGHLLYSTTAGDMTNNYATYHTPVELPTGGYRFRMIDTNNTGYNNWSYPENFRLYDASGTLVESWGMGGSGIGSADEWFIVDCQDDTDSDTYTWPSDWCEPLLDTSMGFSDGACSAVLHIDAGYDYYDMGVTLKDSDGNVVIEIEPGDLTQAGDFYYSIDFPSDGYQILLEDAAGYTWDSTAFVEVLQGDGCVEDMETVAGPWDVSWNNTEAIGGQWDEYFIHSCGDDTGDSFTWDSGWCEPILDTADVAEGACSYVLAVRSGYDYADMQITITDSDDNEVIQIAAGDLTAEGMFYFPVNMPTDGYTITWSDESTWSEYWDYDAWFQLIPVESGSQCVDLDFDGTEQYTLPSGFGGERTEYLALNCAEDTADTFFEWDTDWCEPVLDSGEQVSGACGYVLEVRADFDYYDMVIELTDSEGNSLVDIQQNDLSSSGYHYFPVNLPSDGYHLHMEDASAWSTAWGTNAHVRLIPADGECLYEDQALESYTVSEFGVADEYFILNCEEDTGDTFSWDTDWCEPILDSAEMPTGDCAYVLEVVADYDYPYMAINITDADGNEIIDIAAGDLTAEDRYYYPINLPTNGYTMTLLDDYTWGISQWGPDAYVRLIPVEEGCFDPEASDAEEYRVDFNGEEIVNFEVDCADDTAEFAWDSAWCEVILEDTAGTGGLTGCEQLIDISTYYGYQMGVEITDASGTVIFDIDYSDLGYYTQYFYTVNMPTGGYQITLYDDGGNGWADYGTYAPGEITIYEGNGVCMGEEAIFGPYTLPDTNGPTDYTDNEMSFNIWVDCAADTSTDTEDTSWMGDSTWSP